CNEVWPKKNGRPSGCAEFGLWRRCSSVTDPLRDMLPPRVLPQAKLGATNVIVFMNWSTKLASCQPVWFFSFNSLPTGMLAPLAQVSCETREKEACSGGVTTQADRVQQHTAQGTPG